MDESPEAVSQLRSPLLSVVCVGQFVQQWKLCEHGVIGQRQDTAWLDLRGTLLPSSRVTSAPALCRTPCRTQRESSGPHRKTAHSTCKAEVLAVHTVRGPQGPAGNGVCWRGVEPAACGEGSLRVSVPGSLCWGAGVGVASFHHLYLPGWVQGAHR